jgi:hypothetical protein
MQRIGVDLQEHVADAQDGALAMSDDNLDLIHVDHSLGDDHRRRRITDGYSLWP